ncbi:hypothetical protein LJC22_01680 [Desulfosarcina sp. OttesenSCG-928-G10]|nr:hypothetical protein [Desulfosarcina sp. OttesenSCG-928-G10]
MPEKTFRQVCECKHCGNEAEMAITCTLEEVDVKAPPKVVSKAESSHTGHAVCEKCGNESDIWLKL